MEEQIESKKQNILIYLILILSIFIFSLTGVCAKFASGQPFLSFKFCLFYGTEILILGIYAIIWQQIIKRLNLSIAYVFKSTSLIWAILWGLIIFNETFSIQKIIGVIIVIAGIIIINVKK